MKRLKHLVDDHLNSLIIGAAAAFFLWLFVSLSGNGGIIGRLFLAVGLLLIAVMIAGSVAAIIDGGESNEKEGLPEETVVDLEADADPDILTLVESVSANHKTKP